MYYLLFANVNNRVREQTAKCHMITQYISDILCNNMPYNCAATVVANNYAISWHDYLLNVQKGTTYIECPRD